MPAKHFRFGDWRLEAAIVVIFATGLAGCAKIDPARIETDAAPQPGGQDAGNDAPTAPGGADARPADVPPVDRYVAPPCVGLQCQQVACAGTPTTISGTVFAPNGTLPLYNVVVFVPNAPLEPFKAGVTCDRCGTAPSGKPIVSTISNEEGKFKLTNAPAGKEIPLVVQVGKWRRKVTIPNVTACQDNPITDANLTRLPRNQQEGDLPKIAVATGTCDQLGCLLPKIGVDPMELGVAGETKAVAYYKERSSAVILGMPRPAFGPPNMTDSTELWNSEATLAKHDVTLLSCECSEMLATKTAASFDAMTRYLAMGGRIFGSHYAYVWLKNASDPMLTGATNIMVPGAGFAMGPLTVDTTFPKGKAMADWMKFVDPAVTYGEIASRQVFNNLANVMRPATQVWASSPTMNAMAAVTPNPRIITVNTPVGVPAEQQCGRAAQLDAHITLPDMGSGINMAAGFPAGCGTMLTKGEAALAFLFFDLAACIQDDTKPVVPPIVVQ